MLLLAHDAAVLRLHQVLLRQSAGRVLGRAVVDLRVAAHRHRASILTSIVATSVIRHFI